MSQSLACLLLLLCVAPMVSATCVSPHRSAAVVRHFRKMYPCPVTGQTTGTCPGWVIDHRWPLCAGGADHPDNMVWSPQDEARLKDKWEWKMCRRLCRETLQE